MAAVFAFLGILLMSIVVAVLAALQLGDYFNANDEFVWVIAGVVTFSVLALVVFGVAYRGVQKARVLNTIAFLLALAAVGFVFLPGLVPWIASHSTNPFTVGVENTYIAAEMAVPAVLAVLVQWGLVRRRLLRTAGEDDLTLWPWVTTAIGGLVILNPIGIGFVAETLKRSGTMIWQFIAEVTLAVVAVLLVMAAIECYIRRRIMRRRLAAGPTPDGGGATARA